MHHEIDLTPLVSATDAVVAVSRSRYRRVAARGAASAETPFRIASLTKPLTAIAAVIAAEAASEDLETLGVDLLGSAADPGLTVSHLLSQTSGLAPVVTASEVAALGEGPDATPTRSRHSRVSSAICSSR